MSLFTELKRRNVFRVGLTYVVASWLLLQLTEVLMEILELPSQVGKTVLLLLIVGLVPALILARAFELTPEGIRRRKTRRWSICDPSPFPSKAYTTGLFTPLSWGIKT